MADDSSHYVRPDQLCIGLFIHLDLSWMDHPFTFGSFKIKNDEQIQTLRQLGLSKIRYSPAKSDVTPLALAATHTQIEINTEPPENSNQTQSAVNAKQQRIALLKQQRKAIEACEKDFIATAKMVKGLDRAIFSRPHESAAAGALLVNKMLDSLMTDKDIAIHLMSDHAGGDESYYHALNVAVLALMLGKELKLPREEIAKLGQAALFHDVGLKEVPDRILLKSEPLNNAEQTLYEQHCEWGATACKAAGLSDDIIQAVAQHHEFCNGTGYPHRLDHKSIHPLARILSLVDHFDALSNQTNLTESYTPHEALAMMFSQQRAKFDAIALNTFIRCMGVYPPGSIVMLSNENYALVVSVNSTRPLKPQVLVYIPGTPKEEAPILDLELETSLNISKSLKASQLPREALEYLSPRKRITYFFSPKEDD